MKEGATALNSTVDWAALAAETATIQCALLGLAQATKIVQSYVVARGPEVGSIVAVVVVVVVVEVPSFEDTEERIDCCLEVVAQSTAVDFETAALEGALGGCCNLPAVGAVAVGRRDGVENTVADVVQGCSVGTDTAFGFDSLELKATRKHRGHMGCALLG